jgi:hypothetical protein
MQWLGKKKSKKNEFANPLGAMRKVLIDSDKASN